MPRVQLERLTRPSRDALLCLPRLLVPSMAFEERRVSKRYIAMVMGELEGSGTIVEPLDGKVKYSSCGHPSVGVFIVPLVVMCRVPTTFACILP